MDELREIQALRERLTRAGYEYYVLDRPTMSDYDYDHQLRRLEELEAAHPEAVTPDSPTQRVGGQALDSFTQVVHKVPLESLQDVFDYDELRQFDQRVRGAVPEAAYDVEPKVDGLSVALEYQDGLFVRGPPGETARWGRTSLRTCAPCAPSLCASLTPTDSSSSGERSICPRRCSTP